MSATIHRSTEPRARTQRLHLTRLHYSGQTPGFHRPKTDSSSSGTDCGQHADDCVPHRGIVVRATFAYIASVYLSTRAMAILDVPAFSARFLRAFASDFTHIRLGRTRGLHPLILTYFVTFRCNLQCTYCDYAVDGFGSRFEDAETSDAKRILTICHEGVPAVAFSGGEPLLRPDIGEIIHHARNLGYRPISLFTNSLLLPYHEDVLNDIDYLQISLDSLDADRQDRLCRHPGLGRHLIANIQRYARMQSIKHFCLNVNCVITSQNVDDVDEILRFAEAEGVRFTFSPHLSPDGQADESLHSPHLKERYRATVDTILAYKRSTRVVLDIVPFIDHMRELRPGPCYPWLTPRVYPDGSMRFPCSIVCRSTSNVLSLGSWARVRDALAETRTDCPAPCLLPCYLESSLLVTHPMSLLQEIS